MELDRLNLPAFQEGSVWLVGAGPGAPELLTLMALHALGSADVVVYDALVDARVLRLARPGAALDFAGKRGGKPSLQQPDITLRLVRLAREGKRVLRLKGGDPFVFGRGGEEALALAAAGIPFRIVPGVTAGIGGLAAAGIPATHRDTNSAVAFVTGQASGGAIPDGIDWASLSRGAPVLVIYMALKHLDAIAARLLAAGRAADEPVAIVSNATLPGQRVLVTTLARAAADAMQSAIEPPAVVVVGPVVPLAARINRMGSNC
ncbi:MAG TPA: uroporphyrinogen-III C-methyltransferase [Stellaceae bacterium]|nr:uroporphyrinogen-III C-methyltransferase [Stellaceae bacterium]